MDSILKIEVKTNSSPDAFSAKLHLHFKQRLAAKELKSNAIARVEVPSFRKLKSSMVRDDFANRQQQFYTTDSQSNVTSHLVARVSPTLTDRTNQPLGMIGFFDAENEPEIVTTLLQAAIDWLTAQGCKSIVGPIDGDTWHSYRFNIGPFDAPVFLSEPTNPDYYSELWKQAGFVVAAGYHSKVVHNIEEVLLKPAESAKQANSQGYKFRPINLADFDSELEVLYRLSINSFNRNFLYNEISLEQFKKLYVDAKPLLHKDLIWIASDKDNKDVGFLFCIVDYAKAVHSMAGRSNMVAKAKFLFNKRHASAVNFKSICVLPEHRRSAVAAALMFRGYQGALARGYKQANLCLIKDDNPSTKLDGGKSQIMRRYELYMTPGSQLNFETRGIVTQDSNQ